MRFPLAIALLAFAAPLGADQQNVRFQGFDGNGDGVITRSEWRGNDQSFDVHDWNNDGVLSGDEIRVGAWRPNAENSSYWENLQNADADDDRSRFDSLDRNGNGVIEREEWRASARSFEWLDRDDNGTISRLELGIAATRSADAFSGLDVNNDQRVTPDEWHWSPRVFNGLDDNNDGTLSRAELNAQQAQPRSAQGEPQFGQFGGGQGGGQQVNVPGVTNFTVQANEPWNDTGIDVQPGDRLTFRATGSIRLSGSADDVADPKGAKGGRNATFAPLPKQPAGLLIGRIGTNGTPFVIGDRQDGMPVRTGGRLFLSVNDDAHEDNVGTFNVVVTVVR
jgi:Ca2+-binding EF-hand superfamily protein